MKLRIQNKDNQHFLMKLNHTIDLWLVREGIINDHFELICEYIVPKRFFNPNTNSVILEHGIRILLGPDTWFIPSINPFIKNYLTLGNSNFTYEYHQPWFYKIPNDIKTLYLDLKPDLLKYFLLNEIILKDLVNVIYVLFSNLIRLDIDHYPV